MTLIKTNTSSMRQFQMKFMLRRSRERNQRIPICRDHLKQSKQSKHSKPSSGPKRIRHRCSGKMYVLNPDGTLRLGNFRDSLWWANYVILPEEMLSERQKKNFRNRFRFPYSEWKKLVNKMNEHEIFARWKRGNTNCAGQSCNPIEILTLGVLKKLGRECSFDDLEEITFISEKTHRTFFKSFIKYGSTVLFDEYVISPETKEDAGNHIQEFIVAGYPGAVGSTDATHVVIKKCRYQIRQAHLGHKMNKTARTYNMTVNHRRQILATTNGHPCTWNDKTLINFDEFISGMHDGSVLDDLEFELLERCEGNLIKKRKYRGGWVLCDNGYLPWSVTMPPSKYSHSIAEIRWSQWLESMRKDVECTFGILKKRFTILDKGIDIKNLEEADQVVLTCCSLHNLLLKIDERDGAWEDGVAMNNSSTNFALNRLNSANNSDEVTSDDDADEESSDDNQMISDYEYASESVTVVRQMHQSIFKSKLVEHFDILFHQNKIVWPKNVEKQRKL